ncbi:MAG: lipopolysaccharide biosynthesis protein [Micrococcales bacterium]|nr:lipopolysaccharide biosynthesis protein [Micrococcales bacterium]
MTEDGLGRSAARGAASTGVGVVVRIALQLVTVVLLARLLDEADFGLFAMVLAVIGVGELLRDAGLSSAAIQAPDLSARQRSNLFWSNTAIGLTLATLVLAGAPLVARLYGEPNLTAVTQALSVTFLLNAMTTQYRASLVRAMRFTAVATIDVLAPATALVVAVVAAAAGARYWALVTQQIVQAVVALVTCATVGRWLPDPRWHRGQGMRRFFRFGGFLLGSQLIGYVANNIDNVLIGRQLGKDVLGVYSRGFQVLMNPLNQVRTPSTTVALPALSRAGTGVQFDRIVRSGQLVLCYPITVGLGIVIGTAYPLVEVLLGPKWAGLPPILRLLAVAGAMQTIAYVGYWVYLSRGLTRQLMAYTTLTSVVKIVLVCLGAVWGFVGLGGEPLTDFFAGPPPDGSPGAVAWAPVAHSGAVGVAAGYALAATLEWPLSLWWLSRLTPLPTRALYGGAGRVLAIGSLVGLAAHGAVWALDALPSWTQVLAGAAAGAGVAAATTLVPRVRRDLGQLVHALRVALSRRR